MTNKTGAGRRTGAARQATAYRVRRPSVSQVYYHELNNDGEAIWFRFAGEAGDLVHFNLGVPVIDRLATFSPEAVLVGPGLSVAIPMELDFGVVDLSGADDARDLIDSIRSLPDYRSGAAGTERPGVLVFREGDRRREFHERFTGTNSWIVVECDVILPAGGEYFLIARPADPAPRRAKLWLAIGTKERFTMQDIFGIRRLLRYVREFHENPEGRRVDP